MSFLAIALSAISSVSALPGIHIQSSSGCPSESDIARRLAPLLSTAVGAEKARIAIVSETARGFVLRLTEADGMVLAEKNFEALTDCARVSEQMAVVIASWQTRLPITAPQGPKGVLSSPTTTETRPLSSSHGSPWHLGSLAGIFMAYGGFELVPALKAGLRASYDGIPFLGVLTLRTIGPDYVEASPIKFRTTQFALGLGPAIERTAEDGLTLLVSVEALVGGFHSTKATDRMRFNPGLDASMMIGWRLRRFCPWLGVSYTGSLYKHYLTDGTDGQTNRQNYVMVGGGVSIGGWH